jgi:hypothetical protein
LPRTKSSTAPEMWNWGRRAWRVGGQQLFRSNNHFFAFI